MARRDYDFRPDKHGSSFISKLYLTKSQRFSLLKWTLYSAVLLVVLMVQDVALCRLNIFGATTDLVPSAIFLVCLLEGAETGCVFSLICSAVFVFSGSAPGNYAMSFITVLGTLLTVFRQTYLRRSFSAAMVCNLTAMVLYEMGVFAAGILQGSTYISRFWPFLTTAIITAIVSPILYPILLSIEKIGGNTWKE